MAGQRKKAPQVRGAKDQAQDDLVMATNNSSIVSKRSVERLYYPNEPHFFRFFVKKFQRRAPLINRGYHFRLHVIDVTLRNFLKAPSSRKKVAINLGCGSDVIPWQCWTRYPSHCEDTIFIDVDFPDLIKKKRQVVLSTSDLSSPLLNVESADDSLVLLRSDRYYQIGCDLRQTETLQQALASIIDFPQVHILFIAEVSITYMETVAADSLLEWASSLAQAEFCLLEQVLPDGPEHPFATTMLEHFDKLNSSIKSVRTYPTLTDQRARFLSRGWTRLSIWSLWSAWADDFFLTADERRRLDEVEPFDEWEEFALFASHYFILHARNYGEANETSMQTSKLCSETPSLETSMTYKQFPGHQSIRRFGAPMMANDVLGNEFIVNCMGLGANTRLSSYDVYSTSSHGHFYLQPGGPPSRMCYTSINLGKHGNLLVGGRSSPSSPLNDCWIFKHDTRRWERTWDLPVPLYRHSACRVGNSSLALVIGGKSGPSEVSGSVLLYHPEKGWLECDIQGSTRPRPVFGAALASSGRDFHGLLSGGISEDGLIDNQVLIWKLDFKNDEKKPVITFTTNSTAGRDAAILLPRFGSACVQSNGYLIVVGGVCCEGTITQKDDILVCSLTESKCEVVGRVVDPSVLSGKVPRPLLIGSSVILTSDGQVVIMGGGATCFSMGTFWTKGTYSFALDFTSLAVSMPRITVKEWDFSNSGDIVKATGDTAVITSNGQQEQPQVKVIPRVRIDSQDSFESLLKKGLPVILEDLNLGSCCKDWSLYHLTKQIGSDRKVTVHESHTPNMDFNAKNFKYATKEFGTFAKGIKNGQKMYLRGLSAEAPADQPANLNEDYPSLAAEFCLPAELSFVVDNMHSSVLRISGPVNMWLHYDVMANVYCQIKGEKRLILFPPADVVHLSIPPGASSSSIDVFSSIDTPALASTHPYEANLSSGDVLFLPPLWLHTATPTSDTSVAVNVFFRSLEAGYSAGRDVYGNRDLLAYEKGRLDITKITNAFSKIPGDVKQFYMSRLAAELLEKSSTRCS